MARIARIVIPNHPHHIIHRGNRREKVFFSEDDKQAYLCLLTNQAKKSGIEFSLGDERFIKKIEGITGKILQKNRPGHMQKDS